MNLKNLINHIVITRTIKRLSQEDCAHMLGISTVDYNNFEQGVALISLPELELLSHYLGISLENHLSNEIYSNTSQINMLKESLRPYFKSLRNKMIGAKMAQQCSEKDISLDELQQATGIPLEKLTAYQQALEPIPINHLQDIADTLSLSLEGFINPQEKPQNINESEIIQEDRRPNIHQTEMAEDREYEYQILIKAIKAMPIDEQAKMAKFVLSTLKNQ